MESLYKKIESLCNQHKDISKATASTVLHIAQTLGVTAEELLQQKEPEA
jgi:plasmid maintenance system antidote protein VapI